MFSISKQRHRLCWLGVLSLWVGFTQAAAAPSNIITLTPHATELVFAAGAGDQIVGTVNSSDFPESAKSIARIGDGLNTSVEQVISLEPDWVVGWPSTLLSQLEALGIQTVPSTPDSLEAIGQEVLRLGQAFGTHSHAQAWHETYIRQIQALNLQTAPGNTDPIKIVVLASADGQFVIGRHALINDTLKRCGAINPFAQTLGAAVNVSPESLIAANPDVIITGTQPDSASLPMAPVAALALIDADSLYRPGPRFINAAIEICKSANQARQKRSQQ